MSADGHSLALAGYNPVPVASPEAVRFRPYCRPAPRAYGSVDYTGTYTFGGTFASNYSANNIRGAATDNGTNFWVLAQTPVPC